MSREPQYQFDETTQREIILDPEAARDWVRALEAQGLIGDPLRVVWLRILGRLDEAESLGWEVLARSGGPALPAALPTASLPLTSVTAAVRLAHVLQWRGEFETARELYWKALSTVQSVEALTEDSAYADYLHPFVHQHLARCHFDRGDYLAAIESARNALELRRSTGAPSEHLLESESLIRVAQSRANASAVG